MYLHCFRRSQLTYEVWILHHLSKLGIGIYHITHLGIQPKNLTIEITLDIKTMHSKITDNEIYYTIESNGGKGFM